MRSHHLLLAPLIVLLLCPSALAQTKPRKKKVDPAATHEIPPFLVPEVKPGVTYQRFIAMGDWGTGSRDQKRTAEAMAKRAATDGVDFIITTGDNFYSNGVKSVDDPQWTTKWKTVYSAKSLQIPWHPTLGNHDHNGNVQAQIEFSKQDPVWRMPAAHYTYTRPLGNGQVVQFFAIDTDYIGLMRGKQKEWLDAELRKSKARWKIVYGHHPLYSHSKRPYNGFLIRSLEPLLLEHKVDLYLAGHDHTLEMLKPVKGVHYVVTGAGGGPRKAYPVSWTDKSFYAATLGGYVLCRVSRNELVIEFVRMNGKTQYSHTLYKGRIGPL